MKVARGSRGRGNGQRTSTRTVDGMDAGERSRQDGGGHDPMPSTVVDAGRRRVVVNLLGFAAAALGGCAAGGATTRGSAPILGPELAVPEATPRAGDRWRYLFTSGWPGTAPIRFTCRVTGVTETSISDVLSVDGMAGEQVMTFTGRLDMAVRALNGVSLTEFAPYVQAFTRLDTQVWSDIPVAIGSSAPQAAYVRARVNIVQPVTVPAGTFAATRVELASQTADGGQMSAVAWFAPQAKRWVKLTYDTWNPRNQPIDRSTFELFELLLSR